jgi:hypothetical protein
LRNHSLLDCTVQEVRSVDPVSSRVFRLARTAAHRHKAAGRIDTGGYRLILRCVFIEAALDYERRLRQMRFHKEKLVAVRIAEPEHRRLGLRSLDRADTGLDG